MGQGSSQLAYSQYIKSDGQRRVSEEVGHQPYHPNFQEGGEKQLR
jgi:hypothetical protein